MSRTRLWRLIGVSLGFVLLVGLPVLAQEEVQPRLEPALHFTHLTSDEGLAQNSVEAIIQDRRGFMWFGTTDGLSRYDGYHFKTYRNEPDNPNSLSQNWVRGLYEARDGMLWIALEGGGGFNKFDPSTETFTRYEPDRNSPNRLQGDRVLKIFQDSTQHFWFSGIGNTGLNRADSSAQSFSRYRADDNQPGGFQGGGVGDILEDDAGNLWMAATQSLIQYDLHTEHFTTYLAPTKDERWSVVHRDPSGKLWVAGSGGLYQFDRQQKSFIRVSNLRGVEDLTDAENDNFWIATGSGLYLLDPCTGEMLQHYRHDAGQADSLSSTNVKRVYQDKAGVVWIGTANAGLNVFDPRQTQFAYYRYNPIAPVSMAEGAVNTLYAADPNHLWVGVRGSLDLVQLDTGQVTHYIPKSDNPATISAVYQDHAGVVWVGTNDFKLYQLDPTTGKFSLYPLKSAVTNRQTPAKFVVDFYEDKRGVLWIAVNHDGLYRLDAARETLQFFDAPRPGPVTDTDTPPNKASKPPGAETSSDNAPKPPDEDSPPNSAPKPPNIIVAPITDLYGDRAGNIWVSTLNGFSRFDPQTGKFQRFRAKVGDDGPDSYIESLFEDRNGRLWVASRDGLVRLDANFQADQRYLEKDGLPTNWIVGIQEDGDGNLWLSTKKGLSRFTPADGKFRNYTAADGLQGNEFNAQAFAQNAAGQMFFGGVKGLTAFYPKNITDSGYLPPVVLTDFQLANKSVIPGKNPVLVRPIWATDSVTLTHDQNIVSFEFAVLDYPSPTKNQYQYKLEGFEEQWNPVSDGLRHFATYTNLPAGNYVFRVQATNGEGLWSDKEVALKLTVQPPWWAETWFRILMVVGVIGVLFSLYWWRIYAMRRRNRELVREVAQQTQVLQERTQALEISEVQLRHAKDAAETANRAKSAFLASMSHELRSPLNAILGFAQVTKRNANLPREVQGNVGIILRSGEHLLALINQVLDLSKIEAGQMVLNEVSFDLYQLLEDLEDMFLLKADDKHLQLNFERSADLPRYLFADAVRLRQVLINLMSNALKFTEKGSITVRGKRLPSDDERDAARTRLHFEVADTGPGIPQEEMSALFQAFAQTSSGRRAQEGTGLGLTISHRFVELMGGKMTVNSTVGQGTTFAFDIQSMEVATGEVLETDTKQRVVGLQPGQPPYRVLVVDDKWVNRQLMLQLLTPLGFDVQEAENGKEALDRVPDFQPHLIWMDMRMPVMDGMEATRQIKATPEGKAAVIIALTASAYDEERVEILAAGCDDFVRKPFRAEDIFNIVSKHIGVQYVYASDDQAKTEASREPLPLEDLKAAANSLPMELVNRLRENTELGDVDLIDQTIAEIGQHQPVLGEALTRIARRFDYDELLDILKEATP